MPLLKRFGIAIVVVFALSVTLVAMASAADPLFLFGGQSGKLEKGEGALSTLTNFFSIECKKSSTGSVAAANESDTFTGEIEFHECTGTSLGSTSGNIKFKFKGLTCLWGAAETELKPCAYIEATENVHIELPLAQLVDFLAGSSQACKLSPDGTSTTDLELKCESSAKGDPVLTSVKDLGATLTPKINVLENHSGTETMGSIAATFLIMFTNAGTLDA